MNKKKILSLIMALVMLVGVFSPLTAFADSKNDAADETTETVTLHKMLMDKGNLNAKKVIITTGTGDTATKESKVIVLKDGKYYDSKNLTTALEETNDFVKAYKGETLAGKTAIATPVFAGTVGINGTEYNGKQINDLTGFFGTGSKQIAGVYFAVKYNDGPNSGKFVTIKTDTKETKKPEYGAVESLDAQLPEGFELLAGLTGKDGIKFTTKGLKGNYLIEEYREKSSYKGDKQEQLAATKAVPVDITLPLVNNDGVVKDAHVYPKNTEDKPKIDKNFSVEEAKKHISAEEATKLDTAIQHKVAFDKAKKAYAETSTEYQQAEKAYTKEDKELIAKWGIDFDNNQRDKQEVTKKIGDDVKYVVETEIPKDAKYKKLVWNDNMTKGLTYNKDLKIEGAGLVADDYSVIATDRGFTLVLKESGLTKVENEAKKADVTLKLTYSAKVNENSIVDTPDLNDIALDYSNKPGKDNEPKEFTPGKKEITMKKSWDITGDQTVTEADKGVTAYFTLQKKNAEGKWEDVETVEKTEKDNFEVTFKNLDENGTYRIVESVKGYEAEYMEYNSETGKIEIKNHKNTDNPEKLNPSEPKVVTGGKKFVKTSQDANERLAGAEFWIKNNITGDPDNGKYLVATKKDAKAVTDAKKALDDAVTAYNNLSAEDQKGEKGTAAKKLINDKQDDYNKAFKKNATAYTWGKKDDANVVVLTSDGEGKFEITGLAYGDYKLEEKTPPAGFAKLNGDIDFKVAKGSYDGAAGYKKGEDEPKHINYKLAETNKTDAQQIVNKKVSIPQTGGIGTVLFTVVGIGLMAGAVMAMKKNREEA